MNDKNSFLIVVNMKDGGGGEGCAARRAWSSHDIYQFYNAIRYSV